MLVETYEVTESIDGLDVTDEMTRSIELIEEIGLEGQSKLVGKKGDDEGHAQAIPFRKMTKYESNVYRTLLPRRCKVDAFSASLIPLRVLEIVKGYRDLFEQVDVMYSDEDPDPVLVGVLKNPNSTWIKEDFLLARWGEELQSIDVLAKKALKIIKSSVDQKLSKIKSTIESDIMAAEKIGEHTLYGTVPDPYYHSPF